ncbi:MAG: phosphatase PAP2 family protein [Oscillospiraceae bacterium]|nr:phosphatase PAP2 family protein [Oscillospiraceae bacterium]
MKKDVGGKPQKPRLALPRHTLPLMVVTWAWQLCAFYLPKLLMDGRPHHDLATAADALVPLAPATVVIYIAALASWPFCYLYCAAQEKERAYRFLCAEFLAKLICMTCFFLLPTAIVRPEITGSGFFNWLLRVVYWFDTPTNLFPSIHCLMNWLCYLGVRDAPGAPRWAKAGMLVFALAVFVSVATVKQHFLVDVPAGVATAQLCYALAGTRGVRRVYEKAADKIVALAYPPRTCRRAGYEREESGR